MKKNKQVFVNLFSTKTTTHDFKVQILHILKATKYQGGKKMKKDNQLSTMLQCGLCKKKCVWPIKAPTNQLDMVDV